MYCRSAAFTASAASVQIRDRLGLGADGDQLQPGGGRVLSEICTLSPGHHVRIPRRSRPGTGPRPPRPGTTRRTTTGRLALPARWSESILRSPGGLPAPPNPLRGDGGPEGTRCAPSVRSGPSARLCRWRTVQMFCFFRVGVSLTIRARPSIVRCPMLLLPVHLHLRRPSVGGEVPSFLPVALNSWDFDVPEVTPRNSPISSWV